MMNPAEIKKIANTTHGLYFIEKGKRRPEYSTWNQMKSRCLNPNDNSYHNYGGKGISICDRWLKSFANFFYDMGEKPSKAHSIDRINNNGNYEPSNCRWATKKEQANNVNKNKFLEYHGERKTLAMWAADLGVNPSSLDYRIRKGWSTEKVLSIPIKKKVLLSQDLRESINAFALSGLTIKEVSKITGVNYQTVATIFKKVRR